ncbi:MAG: hypothetical protein JXR91_02460 [Deltaproteobacteria bacterium]|nr:hypothetical protein [Deltaproteobacteria bacterium]
MLKLFKYSPLFLFVILWSFMGCSSPLQSQNFFIKAAKDDPMLEPIHTTPLYTVYYDYGLQRCVLHSSYTWGESGGGTGGTGIGVTIFNCNPQRLKEHSQSLRRKESMGVTKFNYPRSQSSSPNKKSQKKDIPPKSSAMRPIEAPKVKDADIEENKNTFEEDNTPEKVENQTDDSDENGENLNSLPPQPVYHK